MTTETVWILGDQLNRDVGALAGRSPGDCRVLLVVSEAKRASKRWHRQRLHLVLSAMAHFAHELEDEGFEVDLRHAPTLETGLRAHCDAFDVDRVIAMEPMSWDGKGMLERAGVETVRNTQFLCHYDDFAQWAAGRTTLKMEDFYRWQRRRLDVLMDPDADGSHPIGGRWNFDHDNREPPPKDGRSWPEITRFELDAVDAEIIASFGDDVWGDEPDGTWPVTPGAGPDPPRRVRLTRPRSIRPARGCDARCRVEVGPLGARIVDESRVASSRRGGRCGRAGLPPWRSTVEFGRGVHPTGRGLARVRLGRLLALDARLPATAMRSTPGERFHRRFTGETGTQMACVANVIGHVRQHGYANHIERLMVLGNLGADRRRAPICDDRLDVGELRRWCRVGHASQRGRHGTPRRWRADGHEALRVGWRLHQQDERLLPRVSVQPEEANRRRRLPLHHPLLGLPRPERGCAEGQPSAWAGSWRRCASSPISTTCENGAQVVLSELEAGTL